MWKIEKTAELTVKIPTIQQTHENRFIPENEIQFEIEHERKFCFLILTAKEAIVFYQ